MTAPICSAPFCANSSGVQLDSDWRSAPVVIDLDAARTGALVISDMNFYFGQTVDELGSIRGSITYAPDYDGYTFAAKLYRGKRPLRGLGGPADPADQSVHAG